MDQGPLVIEQIDAGMEFVDRLEEHLPVRAAFWMKAADGGRWYLYIASDQINHSPLGAGYATVSRVAREMDDPNLDPFQIKLIGSDDPLARAALDAHHRFVGRMPARFRGSQFGDVSVEEVYLYPPPPYGPNAEKWRGISIRLWPEPEPEGAYRIEFWPRELARLTPGPGKAKRIPRPAVVLVQDGRIREYRPPENPMPHLTQRDYEEKALEAIEQEVAKGA